MKKITIFFAFLLAIFLAPRIALATRTVSQYLDWPLEAKQTYMMGLVDTFNHWFLFPPRADKDSEVITPKSAFPNFDKCISDLTYGDIRGIVEAYMGAHPKDKDKERAVSSVFLIAMEEDCKKRGFDTKEYLW
ncbi:MAG: hypothetical protein HZA01_11290 [Nitrospinae bacterium]|nr:hypothetical protein [Nitrospinota bacterium]